MTCSAVFTLDAATAQRFEPKTRHRQADACHLEIGGSGPSEIHHREATLPSFVCLL